MTSHPIRVFLVDDHELVRRGITAFLATAGDIDVVGEAATAAQAVRRIPALAPDVVLLDLRLPDGSGIDVCRAIASTGAATRSIILTAFDDSDAVLAAVVAGAAGFFRKDVTGDRLIDGIRLVTDGASLLDADVIARATRDLHAARGHEDQLLALSERERQVLTLIADGLTNRQIASRLFLAEKTVKNYVSSVLTKLGLHSRTQAAVLRVGSAWHGSGDRDFERGTIEPARLAGRSGPGRSHGEVPRRSGGSTESS
ncbi:response regulator transcription factor [Amnibacterium kyonggiense]|uniref:LuxR family two component transcriptional regulator n=1 Tax=Amnibacterium kyonggiense TaxID=595671 RepID=A0A4R7FQW2_9MICO|nr:LuxR family two component transcriptional regulator [Amnibacterium kyonggiense]